MITISTISTHDGQHASVDHTFSREQLAEFGQSFLTHITGHSELDSGLLDELDAALQQTLGVGLASFTWPAFVTDGLDTTGDAAGDWRELATCYPYAWGAMMAELARWHEKPDAAVLHLGQALSWANHAEGAPVPLPGSMVRAFHLIDDRLVYETSYPGERHLLDLLANRIVSRETIVTQLSTLIEQVAASHEPVLS